MTAKKKQPSKQSKKKPRERNDLQDAFIREYLVDLNATASYRRAGYKVTSDVTAASNGSRLLRNAKVKAKIEAALAKVAKRSEATVERLEWELERIALADIRRLFRDDDTLKSPKEWDEDTAASVGAVDSLEQFGTAETGEAIDGGKTKPRRRLTGYLKKLKTWDKIAALVALLKRRDLARIGELRSKKNPVQIVGIEVIMPEGYQPRPE